MSYKKIPKQIIYTSSAGFLSSAVALAGLLKCFLPSKEVLGADSGVQSLMCGHAWTKSREEKPRSQCAQAACFSDVVPGGLLDLVVAAEGTDAHPWLPYSSRAHTVLLAVVHKQLSLVTQPETEMSSFLVARVHRAYGSPTAQLNGLIQDYSELHDFPLSSFSSFDHQINPGSTKLLFFFFSSIFGPTDFNKKFRWNMHYCGKKYF